MWEKLSFKNSYTELLTIKFFNNFRLHITLNVVNFLVSLNKSSFNILCEFNKFISIYFINYWKEQYLLLFNIFLYS